MSKIKEAKQDLENLQVDTIEMQERLTKPEALRQIHEKFVQDDEETALNRAAIQELMDFVSPFDQKDLDDRGMGDRFNINFGQASAIKNEAVGAYMDIFTSPTSLIKIALDPDVPDENRATWADIMSDEWTKMFRAWDKSTPNMLLLADLFVGQGIAIPWFEDKSSMNFEVSSLEECKFDANAVAVPSEVEAMTIERWLSVPELFAKIEGREDMKDIDGWNGPMVRRLIETAQPRGTDPEPWNYEEASRLVKASRLSAGTSLPSVCLIWGVIRELDGSISVYATHKEDALLNGEKVSAGMETEWVYRKRSAYDDANQMFQIFAFSVGNKNLIYTIRGLGYPLYGSGQADNILRCKMLDSARSRSGEMYQPESTIDAVTDLQFIDIGMGMVVPKGLKGVPVQNMLRMEDGIGYALDSNKMMLEKHSAGLSSSSLVENPNSRRNEMQVTAELEHLNKMTGFAVTLYYAPYDKLMRELVRRSFQETQTDLSIAKLVRKMKKACQRRGVPKDMFGKIDIDSTSATRLMGAGSKGSRIIAFQQLSSLYSSMDPTGQEFFNYDFASEIKGSEAAQRYFGIPGQRRDHVDEALAELENNDLLEGQMIEPKDGENKMVHLRSHLERLVVGVQGVNEGSIDLADWTIRHIPLYRHTVDTLDQTSVHESMMRDLNSMRQQLQQIGEIIENGLRHLNKLRLEQQEQAQQGQQGQQVDENGNPVQGGGGDYTDAAQEDNDLKAAKMFAEAQAKIEIQREMSRAKMDIDRQQSMAKIAMMSAETAAKIRRQQALDAVTRK